VIKKRHKDKKMDETLLPLHHHFHERCFHGLGHQLLSYPMANDSAELPSSSKRGDEPSAGGGAAAYLYNSEALGFSEVSFFNLYMEINFYNKKEYFSNSIF
jgi:hypothetical protein